MGCYVSFEIRIKLQKQLHGTITRPFGSVRCGAPFKFNPRLSECIEYFLGRLFRMNRRDFCTQLLFVHMNI